MSKDLPEFTRSVAVTPAKVVDVQAPFDQLSKVLEQFSQGAQRLATRAATERAAQEGAEAGAAPDFKGKLAPGITAPTEAFNKAALASNKMQTQMDIRSSIQDIHDFVTSPKNLGVGSVKIYDDLATKKWASLQPNIPKQNLQAAQNYFQFEAGNARRSVVQRTNALKFDIMQSQHKQYQLGIQGEALTNAYSGDRIAAAGLAGQASQNNQEAVVGGITSQEVADTMGKNLNIGLQQQSILGGYSRALGTGAGDEYLKDYGKAALPDMDILQRTQLNGQMAGMAAIFQQIKEANTASLRQQYVDNNSRLQSGAHIDPKLQAQFPHASAKFWNEFEPKFAASKLINTGLTALRFASLADSKIALKAFIGETLKIPTDIDAQRVIKAVERGRKLQLAAIKKDPAGYNQQNPGYIQAQLIEQQQQTAQIQSETQDIEKGFSTGQIDDRGVHLVGNSNDVLLNIERGQGVSEQDLSLLSNQQASQIAQNIKTLPLDEQAAQMMAIQRQFGVHANIVVRDLNQHGLPAITMITTAMASHPKSAGDTLTYINMKELDPKELTQQGDLAFERWSTTVDSNGQTPTKKTISTAITVALEPMFQSLDASSGTTTVVKQQLFNESLQLAKAFGANGMAPDEAVKRATDDIVNNNYNFASQAGFAPLRVPHTQNAEAVIAARRGEIRLLTSENLTIPKYISNSPQFAFLTPEEQQQEYKQDIIRHGRWIASPDGSGVLFVSGPTTQGQPILDENGVRAFQSFADINSGTSKINELTPTDRMREGLVSRGLLPPTDKLTQFADIAGRLASGSSLSSEQATTLIGVGKNIKDAIVLSKQLGVVGIQLTGKVIVNVAKWVGRFSVPPTPAQIQQLIALPPGELETLIKKPPKGSISDILAQG